MRIAVLADIHGNLTALEAVLADLRACDVNGIIVAGDMVLGPSSVRALQRLREQNAWMIRGNNENYLVQLADGTAPDWWQTTHQSAPKLWEFEQMDSRSLDFIRSLPEQRVITFPGKDSIRVVHGSVDSVSEHLDPRGGMEALDRSLAKINEPVLACGHSHVPWQVMRDGCLAFNPGAVSGPINGVTGAQYAILDWKGDGWELEFRLVKYDLSKAREEFVKSGFLGAGGGFARACLMEIERGIPFALPLVKYAYQQAAQAGSSNSEYVPNEIWDRAVETFHWEQ